MSSSIEIPIKGTDEKEDETISSVPANVLDVARHLIQMMNGQEKEEDKKNEPIIVPENVKELARRVIRMKTVYKLEDDNNGSPMSKKPKLEENASVKKG